LVPADRRVHEYYAPSPWFFAPGGEGISPRLAFARPRTSPNPSAPALGTALLHKDKKAVVAKEALHRVLSLLEADTGLSFTGSDAERLGDLEMFVFPAAHPNEHPKAHLEVILGSPVISIDGLPAGASVLVACTQEAHGLILGSETRRASAMDGRARIEFQPTPDGPHLTTVQIWIEHGDGAGLWFLQTLSFIRRISMRMNIRGGTTDLYSPWLEPWARSRRTKDAAAKLRVVQRTEADRASVIGEPPGAFVAALQSGRQWTTRTVPEKSRGRLFAAGGAPDGDRLAFATWLREELGRPDEVSRVILLDPFFDDWGLELLARLENASCSYEVITALRRPNQSEDETLGTLRAASERMDVVLRGLRLRLVGLRGERPFHDRLVLGFDGENEVVRGFHLSNSLDGAAKRFPLLVTAIGDDVLQGVADYVADLVTTYRPESIREPAPHVPGKVPVAEEPGEEIEALAQHVAQAADDAFADAWFALTAKLAHVPTGIRDVERSLIEQTGPQLFGRIEHWLVSGSTQVPRPRGVSDVTATSEALAILTPYAERRFVQVSRVAGQLVDHWHGLHVSPWTVTFAFGILAEFAPSRFAAVVDEIVGAMPVVSDDVAVRSRCGALLHEATSCLIEHLALTEASAIGALLVAVLKAETPFLRAIGAAALGDRVLAQGPLHSRENYVILPNDAFVLLQHVSADERVVAMAMWVGDLRVAANRQGHREDDASRTLRQVLMAQIVTSWPANAPAELLADVVSRVEGPISGGWADSTTNDLLAPLTRAHKIEDADARRVWLSLLEGRLSSLLAGTYQYFGSSDGPLTQVAAQLVAGEGSADGLPTFERTARAARSRVVRPFGRAHYAEWSHARDALLWVGTFARLVAEQAPHGSSAHVAATSIMAIEDDAQSRMRDHREMRRPQDANGLTAFAQAVRDRTGGSRPLGGH
jgi:hypothetical protein